MDKKALYNLLGKYLDHTCTENERKMVDEWLELLQDNQAFAAYTTADLDSIHQKIWTKIQHDTYKHTAVKHPAVIKPLLRYAGWIVAASLVGALAIGAFYFSNHTPAASPGFSSIIPNKNIIRRSNTTSKPTAMRLEDSTLVVLEPGAILGYPAHFEAGQREVYLEGKAFFDVSKNAHRPFFIYHNNLVTHVIGTSFFINTRKAAREVEVSVLTGRVEVSENTRLIAPQKNQYANGVVLAPNQKVIYSEDSRLFVASVADKPVALPEKKTEHFRFENATLDEVLAALSKEYAIEIVLENEEISKCTFTGDISKQDLYSKLALICKSVNCSYEIKGTMLLVKGEGCE